LTSYLFSKKNINFPRLSPHKSTTISYKSYKKHHPNSSFNQDELLKLVSSEKKEITTKVINVNHSETLKKTQRNDSNNKEVTEFVPEKIVSTQFKKEPEKPQTQEKKKTEDFILSGAKYEPINTVRSAVKKRSLIINLGSNAQRLMEIANEDNTKEDTSQKMIRHGNNRKSLNMSMIEQPVSNPNLTTTTREIKNIKQLQQKNNKHGSQNEITKYYNSNMDMDKKTNKMKFEYLSNTVAKKENCMGENILKPQFGHKASIDMSATANIGGILKRMKK